MTRIGLNCALSTPITAKGTVDLVRLAHHARWVLANGCDGFTLFGTTGEGASLGTPERREMLGAIAGAGFDMRRQVIAGVSAASIQEALAQAVAGYDLDCRALLVAPPFYFHGAGDDGVFRFFAALFERLGGRLRDIVLYHIPGMTGVPVSVEVTQRLMAAFPGAIAGVKDSAGDWMMTERRLAELPGLQILVGDERQLARAVQQGGAGTICGLANIAPDLLRPLAEDGRDDPRIHEMVNAILEHSFMSAIKALIAAANGDPAWRTMRPPLEPMREADAARLAARIDDIRRARAA